MTALEAQGPYQGPGKGEFRAVIEPRDRSSEASRHRKGRTKSTKKETERVVTPEQSEFLEGLARERLKELDREINNEDVVIFLS